MMRRIVLAHYPDIEERLLQSALAAFYDVREIRGLHKKPSTSELLDWIRALRYSGIEESRIEKEIPFAGVLLKKNEDLDLLYREKHRGFGRK
jgi:MoxR-like ATPase